MEALGFQSSGTDYTDSKALVILLSLHLKELK